MKLISLVILTFYLQSISLAQCPILPSPTAFVQGQGSFLFENLIFNESDFNEDELMVFRNQLQSISTTNIVLINEGALIEMTVLPENSKADYYEISVQQNKIRINYSSEASKMYALLSLVQLIEDKNGSFAIQCCEVKDSPKFEWRGLHLDVARHFFELDEVLKFIDLMTFYKFNKFHWHLTDDQGWRIEIKKYPLLTEIGAFRDSTIIGHYNQQPWKWNYDRVGGYYTQEEVKRVIEYAQNRNIEVIPEIEMPGHARAALAAYPNLGCTQMNMSVAGTWGVFEDVFCSKDETISFLQDVLSEVIDLFPSQYIHIGGDEAPKTRWNDCEKCKANMIEHHLKDAHGLQSYFIQKMDSFITSKGKKMIGWDEILEGGLSPNAIVMSWRGESGGVEAANQNHEVIMSPTTYCYFDYYQSGDLNEPLAIGGYLPLEKVYNFSVIPTELSAEKAKYILGGQANLWTEYIEKYDQVEYMVYPRALAMIQNLWCENKPNYDAFLSIFRNYHEDFLTKKGVNYSKSIYQPKLQIERAENGVKYSLASLNSDVYFGYHNLIFDVLSTIDEIKPADDVIIESNEISFEPSKIGKSAYIINYGSNKSGVKSSLKIIAHKALGAKVELITKPHSKYANGGDLTLVDGIIANRPWKGDQWLGFNEQEVEFIIENSGAPIKTIYLDYLNAKGSWIYLPESVEIYVSSNKKTWKLLKSVEISKELTAISLSTKAKYIKIKSKSLEKIPDGAEGAGNLPWTFISEIILE